jgi:hypothetical protein
MSSTWLPTDWILRPTLDLEFKQYEFLAYLQTLRSELEHLRLYPALRSMAARLRDLRQLETGLSGAQPSVASIHALAPLGAQEREVPEPHDALGTVVALVAYAVPRLEDVLKEGIDLRKELASHIHLSTVGLLPLDQSTGYLLVHQGKEAHAYRYDASLVRTASRTDFGLNLATRHVAHYTVGLATTYEWIKLDLVERDRELPNPAMFAFEAEVELPRLETYLPLAKRLVHEQLFPHLSGAA